MDTCKPVRVCTCVSLSVFMWWRLTTAVSKILLYDCCIRTTAHIIPSLIQDLKRRYLSSFLHHPICFESSSFFVVGHHFRIYRTETREIPCVQWATKWNTYQISKIKSSKGKNNQNNKTVLAWRSFLHAEADAQLCTTLNLQNELNMFLWICLSSCCVCGINSTWYIYIHTSILISWAI